MLEKLLDEVLFEAPDMTPQDVVFDAARVRERLGDIVGDSDLSRYVL